MKKKALFSALFLIIAILLVSCATIRHKPVEITEKEASEAMHTVMNRSIESANTRLFQKLTSFNFIPQVYSVFSEKENDIPGMKKLISSWNGYMSAFIESYRDEIEQMTKQTVEEVSFNNAIALVKESTNSGSRVLENLYGEELMSLIKDIVTKVDYSIFEKMVNQYNAWVETKNYLNKTNVNKMQITDCTTYMADIIYGNYVDMVKMYEEIYRTTPDPYTDEICQKVFGIK